MILVYDNEVWGFFHGEIFSCQNLVLSVSLNLKPVFFFFCFFFFFVFFPNQI